MATLLAAPSRSPAVVAAVLSAGPDFRAVLWQAERSATATNVLTDQRRKYIRAYLLATLEHRVAVETKAIPQTERVE